MSGTPSFRAISLFTGIGGLDYGFEAAGFETAVAVEMDSACCRMLRANRPWQVIEDNIHRVSSAKLLATSSRRPIPSIQDASSSG